MAKSVEYMHICDHACTVDGGKHSVIGIFDRIHSVNFPAAHPHMAIAMKLRDEPHRTMQLDVVVARPNGDKVAEISGTIATNDEGAAFLNVNFVNLQFPEAGRYLVKVASSGETLVSQSLILAKLAAPPQVQRVS